MLDVAPVASSQDVSSFGDHPNTATTTPESTVSTNVGGPVNQTPSSSASLALSNLYQSNPVSDSFADGTSGDLSSSTTSSSSSPSSNAIPNPVMADSALETSFSDVAQETSSNSVVAQETSSNSVVAQETSSNSVVTQEISSLPVHASENLSLSDLASANFGNFGAVTQNGAFIGPDPQTLNPVSAFDVFQKPANTVVNTLGSNIQKGATPLTSGSIGNNFAGASPANTVVNALESTVPLTSGSDGSIGTNFAGASLANTVNTLGSNIQKGATPLTSGSIGNNYAGALPANTAANTLGSSIPLTSGSDAFRSIGTNFAGSLPANTVVNALGSSIKNGAIPLHAASNTISDPLKGCICDL